MFLHDLCVMYITCARNTHCTYNLYSVRMYYIIRSVHCSYEQCIEDAYDAQRLFYLRYINMFMYCAFFVLL